MTYTGRRCKERTHANLLGDSQRHEVSGYDQVCSPGFGCSQLHASLMARKGLFSTVTVVTSELRNISKSLCVKRITFSFSLAIGIP